MLRLSFQEFARLFMRREQPAHTSLQILIVTTCPRDVRLTFCHRSVDRRVERRLRARRPLRRESARVRLRRPGRENRRIAVGAGAAVS